MDALSSGIKKFDGSQFEVWSMLMDAVLTAKGIKYVIETEPPKIATGESDKPLIKYQNDNKIARATILLCLEQDIARLVLSCITAKDVWNRLQEVYSRKSDASKMLLYQEFYNTKMQPGSSVSTYVADVELIVRKLRDTGVVIDDETLISKIVSGLTNEFKHFMTSWMSTTPTDRTYANLLPRLLAEETLAINTEGNEVVAMKASARLPQGTKDRSKKDKKAGKKDVECFHCGKIGHYKRDCRKLKREQAASKEKTDSLDDNKGGDRKYAVIAKSTSAAGATWFFDSGASYHIAKNLDWFVEYQEHERKIAIQVGNSEYVYAYGSGTIDAISFVNGSEKKISITDVQYVPEISDNLFSQGSADSKGITAISKNGKLSLMKGDEIIIEGERTSSNMYVLKIQVPMKANVAKVERSIDEWHSALGHPDINEIRNMASKQCVAQFKISNKDQERERCGDCSSGKQCKAAHPESRRERSDEVLHRVHADLVGKVEPPSLGGSEYFMLIRDEYSSFMHVYFMSKKTQVLYQIKKFVNEASIAAQRRLQIFRSDNGTEFKNTGVKLFLESEGVVQEFSAPRVPQQNGEIERANRTVIETARTLLKSSGLPLSLWGEAVLCAVYCRNRITNTRNRDKTPFELFYGKPPTMSHLIEFGREMHLLDDTQGISKFSSKTKEVYMVGYGATTNTYRVWDPKTGNLVISPNVVLARHADSTRTKHVADRPFATFLTVGFPTEDVDEQVEQEALTVERSDQLTLPPVTCEQSRRECNIEPVALGGVVQSIRDYLQDDGPVHTHVNRSVAPVRIDRAQTTSKQVTRPHGQNLLSAQQRTAPTLRREQRAAAASEQSVAVSQLPTAETRSAGGLPPPRTVERPAPVISTRPKRSGIISRYARIAQAVDGEPSSYTDAISGPDCQEWQHAIQAELDAHERNGTWKIVPKHADIREITARWVFKVKLDANGAVERFKARLVVRGFTQRAGVDYDEIYSPVVHGDSLRLLFALCAQYGLVFEQFDIATAFLYGEIKEELYMRPPDGVDVPPNTTCRLLKSIYGLKQAPRCFNDKLSDMLKTFGMWRLKSDPSVYVSNLDGDLLILGLYVDDGICFSKSRKAIKSLLDYLMKIFEVKIINSAYFLGIEIVQDSDKSTIFLHQRGYARRILERFGFVEGRSVAAPLDPGHVLNKPEVLSEDPIDCPYAEVIGSLNYLAKTRPDLCYSLSLLSKYTSAPREAHWVALKRVLRYVRTTMDYGLLYEPVENPRLIVYTDADYAGDQSNSRSTSGMVAYINTGPICFRAQQQPTVSMSTTEAEYVAAAMAVKELIWLKAFLEELKVPVDTDALLLCDNKSAIHLTKNPELHRRTKHIEIKWHFIREKLEEGYFQIEYVESDEQKADIFTKPLLAAKHKAMMQLLGCVMNESNSPRRV